MTKEFHLRVRPELRWLSLLPPARLTAHSTSRHSGISRFMDAYQEALTAAPIAIGKSTRSKPGSISAAIAEYYEARSGLRSLTGGTPARRRVVLEPVSRAVR